MSSGPNKAKQIFLEAIERQAPEQWPAFLNQACGDDAELRRRVEALLDSHASDESLLDSPAMEPVAPILPPTTEAPGTVIGPYKLLQQIGEGGMGVVYMAEQTEPVERFVAMKIIKPGLGTQQVIARFEAERQALAMMDHPNISKVFDAGATDTGRPYFVMELVKGVPITQYCDDHHLSPRERLELFVPVCQAVQHAHQKGIIHRDIKPSNVMVAEYDGRPVPKIIDFGVAKAVEQRLTEKTLFTQLGQVVGTVDYMSPEQATFNQLDIDTRSDIYSLGVLLYELLTGETPLDRQRLRAAAFDEMLRIIREEEPPKPSLRLSSSDALPSVAANRQLEPKKLSTLVRGELDWIVMRALEKDRARRYETANGFAADIGRYLADEPVVACPPSATYRFKKFARRNRTVLGTLLAVLAALLIGMAVSLWQANEADRARGLADQRFLDEQEAHREADEQRERAEANERRATDEAAKAKAVVNLLQQMLGSADPEQGKGAEYTVRELLDEFSAGLGNQLQDQPEVEATIRAMIGRAYYRIMPEKSEPHLKATLELRRRVFGREHEKVAESLLDYAWCLYEIDDLPGAVKRAREALTMYGKLNDQAEPIIKVLRVLQVSLREQAKYAESESVAREALAVARKAGFKEHADLASILHNLSFTKTSQGEHEEGEELGREAVAMHRKVTGDHHPETAWALRSLGWALQLQGKYADAEVQRREALEIFRNQYNDNHKSVRLCLGDLTESLMAQADYTVAEAVWRETLAIRRDQFGEEHASIAEALVELGKILEVSGDDVGSEEHHRRALAIFQKLADQDPDNGHVYYQRAEIYTRLNNYEEAAIDYAKAIELGEASYSNWHQQALCCLASQAPGGYAKACAGMLDRFSESDIALETRFTAWTCSLGPHAVDDYTAVVELARRIVEADPAFAHRQALGAALYRAGQFPEAVQTLASIADSDEPELTSPAYGWYFLAMVHHAEGNSEEATKWLTQANAWADESLAAEDVSWNRRLTLDLLRHEAEALLSVTPNDQQPQDGPETEEPEAEVK